MPKKAKQNETHSNSTDLRTDELQNIRANLVDIDVRMLPNDVRANYPKYLPIGTCVRMSKTLATSYGVI